MIRTTFHTHTSYCDGKNTPFEMAEAAYKLGVEHLGFSGHSYVTFDDCCMSPENTEKYCRDVKALKEQYDGKMNILLGIEKDYYSDVSTDDFDFVIGSVHYLYTDGIYTPVDYKTEIVIDAIQKYYSGDPYEYVRAYYRLVSDLFSHIDADIIGHIDLISKFCDVTDFFDPQDKRYINAWKEAVEALIPHGKPFEINTGAMSRGVRKTPYPSADILRFIKERNGNIIINSDSHSVDTILYGYESAASLARDCGFTSQLIPTLEGFTEIKI